MTAKGWDTEVGVSTAKQLGKGSPPLPRAQGSEEGKQNPFSTPCPAWSRWFQVTQGRRKGRRGWGELAALQDPARREMSHPRQRKAAGCGVHRVTRSCGARRKPPGPAGVLWSTPRCHWMSPPRVSAPNPGKKPFHGHSRVICFSCCKIRAGTAAKGQGEWDLAENTPRDMHKHTDILHARTTPSPYLFLIFFFFSAELARTAGTEPGKTNQPYHPIQEVSL